MAEKKYSLEEIEQARQQGYFIDPETIQHFRGQAANLGGPRVSEEGESLRDPNAYEAYMQAIKGGLQEAGKTKEDFYRHPFSAKQEALQESLGVNEYGNAMPVEYAPIPRNAERYRMWKPGRKPSQKAIDAWERYNWAVENNNNAVKNEASRELRLYGHTPRSMDELRTSVPAKEPKHLLDLEYQQALWEAHKRKTGQ